MEEEFLLKPSVSTTHVIGMQHERCRFVLSRSSSFVPTSGCFKDAAERRRNDIQKDNDSQG